MIESELLSTRPFLVKIALKIGQEEYLFIFDSALKTNPWTYRIKDLNREKIIGSFYEEELLLSKLYMSYYPEPDNHIREKVKVVLQLSSYATKKELEHATGIDAFDLVAKKDFIALRVEVNKLDINELPNVQLV